MPRTTLRRMLGTAGVVSAMTLGSLAGLGAAPAQAVSNGCTITVTGTPQVGSLLTVSVKDTSGLGLTIPGVITLSALDGSLPGQSTVVQSVNGVLDPILHTLQPVTYQVTQSDVAKQLQASFQDSGLGLIACDSALTGPIPATTPTAGGSGAGTGAAGNQTSLGPTAVSTAPRIKGKGRIGKRLRAVLGTVQPGTTVSYQWYRKNKRHAARPIAGATGSSVKVRRGLRGKRVYLMVTYQQTQHTPTALGTNTRKIH